MSNPDASDEIDVALRLDEMHLGQDAPHIAGQSGENLNGTIEIKTNVFKKKSTLVDKPG